jgi:hypothetical protein
MHAHDSKIKSSTQFRFDWHSTPGIAKFRVLLCENRAEGKRHQTERNKSIVDWQERKTDELILISEYLSRALFFHSGIGAWVSDDRADRGERWIGWRKSSAKQRT